MKQVNERNNRDGFDEQLKRIYIFNFARLIADVFLLYHKAATIESYDYQHIVDTALDNWHLGEEDLEEVIFRSKELVRINGKVKIIGETPIKVKATD